MRFWRRKQRERDLEDEIQSHLNFEMQQRIERGEAPEDARANTYRDFGNTGMVKEVTRGMWRLAPLDRLSQDLRHMARYTWSTFRKEPVTLTVTIMTLALVLAAVTLMFGALAASAMHAVLMPQYIGVWASGILGLFTVVLTSLGIYGVASYSAQARTREIGIRTALGARPGRVTYLIIRRSIVLSCVGLVAGCAAGLTFARFVPEDLGFYGVHRFDLPAYVVASLAVFVITLIASYVPSRRAAKADPLAVLRYE